MSIRLRIIVISFLILGGSAIAQENPNNFHARYNAESVANVDRSPRTPATQAPQPTGYWEKTWGAIATTQSGGVLGTAVGASSEAQAGRLAFNDCKTKGGVGCRVDLTYRNQCAAMVVGSKTLRLHGAPTIQEATADGMAACKENRDTCHVYYSACTQPKFHQY